MRITKKFLSLTKFTYPHGKEYQLLDRLPKGYQEDGLGNYYIQIGENPSTMFTCHLDTADKKQTKVKHVFDGNIIKTDGKSILGADDKAGMTVILYMINKRVPGLYYFFIGEEVGCIGSGKLSKEWTKTEFSKYINKIVSFDRRGTSSVITHQMYGRCCSDDFAEELSIRMNNTNNKMNMILDNTGILTDSVKFIHLVPECTNISVGYQNEHTGKETQDIDFLRRLCKTVVEIDWETLPVKRDPLDEDEDEYYDDYYGFGYGSFNSMSKHKSNFDKKEENKEWREENYTHVLLDGKTKKVYIATSQIDEEKSLIYKWLNNYPEYYDLQRIIWNGNTLYAETKNGAIEFVSSRMDLMEMVPELKSIPKSKISEVLPGKKRTFMNAL